MVDKQITNNMSQFITLEDGNTYCVFDIIKVEYLYSVPAKAEIYFENYSTKSNFNLLELISKLQHFNIKLFFERDYELDFGRNRVIRTKYTNFKTYISDEQREHFDKLSFRNNLLNRLINKSTIVSSVNT